MTQSKKYNKYDWIKVKKTEPITIDGKKYVSEKHHIEECEFLIKEIRKLASIVDKKNAFIRKLQNNQQYHTNKNYREESDYLPYQEDDR